MAVEPGIEQELDELCTLACLYLDPAEKEHLGRQLAAVFELLTRVRDVDTTGAGPVFQPAPPAVRFREDEVKPSLSLDLVFDNTANRSGNYFRVPRIAGDEMDEI